MGSAKYFSMTVSFLDYINSVNSAIQHATVFFWLESKGYTDAIQLKK